MLTSALAEDLELRNVHKPPSCRPYLGPVTNAPYGTQHFEPRDRPNNQTPSTFLSGSTPFYMHVLELDERAGAETTVCSSAVAPPQHHQ